MSDSGRGAPGTFQLKTRSCDPGTVQLSSKGLPSTPNTAGLVVLNDKVRHTGGGPIVCV